MKQPEWRGSDYDYISDAPEQAQAHAAWFDADAARITAQEAVRTAQREGWRSPDLDTALQEAEAANEIAQRAYWSLRG